MKPGIYGIPDEVVEMTYRPGASRPSCSFDLRQRVVRIAFDGGYRDILLEERQVYGGWHDTFDRIAWPIMWIGLGFCGAVLLLPMQALCL